MVQVSFILNVHVSNWKKKKLDWVGHTDFMYRVSQPAAFCWRRKQIQLKQKESVPSVSNSQETLTAFQLLCLVFKPCKAKMNYLSESWNRSSSISSPHSSLTARSTR